MFDFVLFCLPVTWTGHRGDAQLLWEARGGPEGRVRALRIHARVHREAGLQALPVGAVVPLHCQLWWTA